MRPPGRAVILSPCPILYPPNNGHYAVIVAWVTGCWLWMLSNGPSSAPLIPSILRALPRRGDSAALSARMLKATSCAFGGANRKPSYLNQQKGSNCIPWTRLLRAPKLGAKYSGGILLWPLPRTCFGLVRLKLTAPHLGIDFGDSALANPNADAGNEGFLQHFQVPHVAIVEVVPLACFGIEGLQANGPASLGPSPQVRLNGELVVMKKEPKRVLLKYRLPDVAQVNVA